MRSLQWSRAPVLLLALALSSGSEIRAQVEIVTVVVNGLACPFCAFGLEKRLGKVSGVAWVEVDVADGSAEITAAKGDSIDFASIPDAVRKAGFTAGDLRITVVGTLELGDEGRIRLRVAGSEEMFRLVRSDSEALADLEELRAERASFRVTGLVRWKADDLPGLETESISRIK